MNMCSDGHEEICYDDRTRRCPLCETIKEKDEKIDTLQDRLKETEAHVKVLLEDNQHLERKLNEPLVVAAHQAVPL